MSIHSYRGKARSLSSGKCHKKTGSGIAELVFLWRCKRAATAARHAGCSLLLPEQFLRLVFSDADEIHLVRHQAALQRH